MQHDSSSSSSSAYIYHEEPDQEMKEPATGLRDSQRIEEKIEEPWAISPARSNGTRDSMSSVEKLTYSSDSDIASLSSDEVFQLNSNKEEMEGNFFL